LAPDPPAGALEEAGKRVAEDGIAAVADGQGPGGVRADELDLYAPSRAGRRATVRLPRSERLAQDHLPEGEREAEVDESRSRHLSAHQPAGGVLQPREDQLGDGARRAPELARDDHRDVAGEVTEARVGRRLDRERRQGGERERAVGHRGAQRLAEQPLKVTLHPGSRGAKDSRRQTARRAGGRTWTCLLFAAARAVKRRSTLVAAIGVSPPLPPAWNAPHPAVARRRV